MDLIGLRSQAILMLEDVALARALSDSALDWLLHGRSQVLATTRKNLL